MRLRNISRKNLLDFAKTLFLVLIAVYIVYEGQKELRAIDFSKTVHMLRSFSASTILIFTVFGLLANALMTLYDFIIVRYLKLDIERMKIFNVSFVANSINNVSGLGGLTGASIRAVFFKKDAGSADDIIRYELFLVPATGVGLSVMAAAVLLRYRYIEPIILENKWLMAVLLGFIAYFFIYFFVDSIFFWYKKQPYEGFNKDNTKIKLKLLLVSLLEWVSASLLLYFIVLQYDRSFSFTPVLVSFTLASIAGVASMLPGGAGSFDFILLLGFKHYGMNVESALAALVMYRMFYYFMPLLIGIIITFSKQLISGRKAVVQNQQLKTFMCRTSNITNMFLRLLVLISGLVLLASALVSGLVERLKIAYRILSLPIMQWSNQISICIGILLLFMSREIGMKVKRSYYATLFLLFVGAVSTFLKGFDIEEAVILTFVFILLFFSKESFYRKSLPFNWLKTIFTVILAFVGILTYVKLRHMILVDFLSAYKTTRVPGMLRFNSVFTGMVSYLSLIIFIIGWQLTKPRIVNDERYESVDDEKIKRFLENNKGNYLTHLIFLKDKHIYWAQGGNVAIVYEKSHNIVVVLGDPTGDDKLFGEAISEFLSFIDEYGYKAAFYQVSDNYLPIYHDLGYVFFKLGETALVNLIEFDLQGPESRSFRNVLSRFCKDGMEFQLFENLPDELYQELKDVSDQWLGKRKEMGFSLGSFDRNYLKHSPVAVVRSCSTDEIVAFATVMPSYDGNRSVSLDLMRFKKDAPKNTMTFLILNLLTNYKDMGYEIFNLGMVPLTNVGNRQRAHLPEKLAHLITLYGNHIYSFAGLRSYKAKFSPSWEPRYLAYENIIWLPSSLIEATLLIH